MADYDLTTKTKRARLEHRSTPYYSRLRAGRYVGYYVPKGGGAGTWWARLRDEDDNEQKFERLGTFEEGKPSAFDQACARALAWFSELDAGARPKGETVEDACRAYVQDRKKVSAKNAADAAGRFRRLVDGTVIGKKPLSKLRADDVRRWLNDQIPDADDVEDDPDAQRRAKDSANRNLSTLKAALNLALTSQLLASDLAWRSVKAFDKVARQRTGELSLEQRKALLKVCPVDLGNFCRAILHAAARPGEIAAATVGDFNAKRGELSLSGKTGPRVVPVSNAAAAFFTGMARGRIAKAPLVPRPDGQHWDRFYWRDAFHEARKAAKLPADVVTYTLRHAAISELLMAGVNPATVAKLAGTSTAMIDRHYNRFIPDRLKEQLSAVEMF